MTNQNNADSANAVLLVDYENYDWSCSKLRLKTGIVGLKKAVKADNASLLATVVFGNVSAMSAEFRRLMMKENVFLVDCPTSRAGKSTVDPTLVAFTHSFLYHMKFDQLYLVSGDMDFIRSMKGLEDRGVTVTVLVAEDESTCGLLCESIGNTVTWAEFHQPLVMDIDSNKTTKEIEEQLDSTSPEYREKLKSSLLGELKKMDISTKIFGFKGMVDALSLKYSATEVEAIKLALEDLQKDGKIISESVRVGDFLEDSERADRVVKRYIIKD